MKTQVAIVGAGPAGLLLGHQLRAAGIECVIVERQSSEYVKNRIRAGVLETVTTDLLHRLGIDARLNAEGLVESGFNLATDDDMIRIDLAALTNRHVTIYGQTELTRDLIDAAPERGLQIVWEAKDVALHGITSNAPYVTWADGQLHAGFIAGCDGFHGPSRKAVVGGLTYERAYPFGWLGILADVAPCHPELIYANTQAGFALASMRSLSRSRYYIQVPLTDQLKDWPETRLWDELDRRFSPLAANPVNRGPALEMSIAPLRSYVFERMHYGRLFLAGDCAHIVPPTGAKGLNLAVSDVIYLADALIAQLRHSDESGLLGYQAKALARIWQAERFSWTLTKLMHRFPEDSDFERKMQLTELSYIASSSTMQTVIAENYIGLPI